MDVVFGDCQLTMPEEPGDDWQARFGEITAYGETAADALFNLGVILDDVTETAEYYRVHAPGVYGHQTSRPVSPGDDRDRIPVSQGNRSEGASPIHPPERQEDRLRSEGDSSVAPKDTGGKEP